MVATIDAAGHRAGPAGPDVLDLVEAAARPHGRPVSANAVWVSVAHGAATITQGWKLHVSARPSTLAPTLERALPVLAGATCGFKVVRDVDVLRALSGPAADPASVGKALTVYPDPDRVTAIANALADVLTGLEGPAILSDRRVRPGAPVWYRYGPFHARLAYDADGDLDAMVEAPDGTRASGLARARWWCPPGIADPFRPAVRGVPEGSAAAGPRLGGRYRLRTGITRTARGDLYRALDERTGTAVVVKQARAYVGEDPHGTDVRAYLRNERRILQVLAGTYGVPEFVDHFRHGADEYLVTTDQGATDLRRDVVERGPFAPTTDDGRSLVDLGERLLTVLDRVHDRGVIIRDVAPKNVMIDDDHALALVDFELSAHDGLQCFGFTPGYSDPGQRDDVPARIAHDLYGLGATLTYALAGWEPVMIDGDPAVNRARTLAGLAALVGADHPAVTTIAALTAPDDGTRRAAAAAIRDGRWRRAVAARTATTVSPLTTRSPVTGTDLAAVIDHTLARVVDHAGALCRSDGLSAAGHPLRAVAYHGSAGTGLELLRHPRARATAHAVATVTARMVGRVEVPPGLWFGRHGIGLFLREAARVTGDAALARAAAPLLPTAADIDGATAADVTHGLAGTGLALLRAAELADDDAERIHLAALSRRCAARLVAGEVRLDPAVTGEGSGPGLDAVVVNDDPHGAAPALGFGHGLGGVAWFLLAHAARHDDPAAAALARRLCDRLAAETTGRLVERARGRRARPMAASWCQGLAGIGLALAGGAVAFADDAYRDAAVAAADAAVALAPRVPLVAPCCGLAGTGELVLDLAALTGDTRHRDAAMDILTLMLRRAGGTPTAPVFPDASLLGDSGDWATGSAGVLTFLRRLADPGAPRLWMPAAPLPPGALADIGRAGSTGETR